MRISGRIIALRADLKEKMYVPAEQHDKIIKDKHDEIKELKKHLELLKNPKEATNE